MADTAEPLTDDRWVDELMSGADGGAAPAAGTVHSGEVAFDVDAVVHHLVEQVSGEQIDRERISSAGA